MMQDQLAWRYHRVMLFNLFKAECLSSFIFSIIFFEVSTLALGVFSDCLLLLHYYYTHNMQSSIKNQN